MLKPEDRALFGTLLAVAMALVLCWAVPSPYSEAQKPSGKCTTHECRGDAAADALAFYTEILAIFTGPGIDNSRGFLYRADKTARISAEAAQRSADAIPTLERAYLFMDGPIAIEVATGDEFANGTGRFKYRNYGKTPAISKRIWTKAVYLPDSDPWRITKALIPMSPESAIASGDTTTELWVPFTLPRNTWDAVLNGDGAFVIFSCIEYEDVFGDTHQTAFCELLMRGANDVWFTPFPSKDLNYRT